MTGSTYTFLVNGHGPSDNWTALFQPGERVRLRFINAAAMTIFNVRIPGLRMSVVQADGQNVRPVEVDEFQIAVAETYDVIVEPRRPRLHAGRRGGRPLRHGARDARAAPGHDAPKSRRCASARWPR